MFKFPIYDLEIDHLDVATAFLNGELEHDIYMSQPEGFVVPGKEKMVYKLGGSLYGLRQSGRQWQKKLCSILFELGFKRLASDHSTYVWAKDGIKVVIPVWVDDLFLCHNHGPTSIKIKQALGAKLKITDSGALSYGVGIRFSRDRSKRELYISQKRYAEDVLSRFHCTHTRPVSTPLDPTVHLSRDQCPAPGSDEQIKMRSIPYLAAVGSLLYLSICSRPDISYAVSTVSQFSSNPAEIHWKAVQHILRYIRGTTNFALRFGPSTSHPEDPALLRAYTDSDWAGADGARSTSGYTVFIGNSLVSWSSKRQTVVAKSTTEAEYIAANHTGSELAWFRNLITELGHPPVSPTPILCDNASAITISNNPEHHTRVRHLSIAYWWLREMVDQKQFKLEKIPTADNTADILTKTLSKPLHERHCQGLGLIRLEISN
jgi:hypothetical protein